MLYTRRFGGFLPFVSFFVSLLVTYLIRPWVEKRFPVNWQYVIVVIGSALFGLFFCVGDVLIVVAIRLTGGQEFRRELRRRWTEHLKSADSEPSQINDYVAKTANLQIRISMPTVLREVTAALFAEKTEVCTSLQRTIDEYSRQNSLGAFINLLANQWRAPQAFSLQPATLIDDPVHGCITLDDELSTVVSQPIVQRLNRVRQLSFSYTRFPSATHSRFSHVLGVARNVEAALSGIFSRGVYYEVGQPGPLPLPKEIIGSRNALVQRAKLIAILHDLGHGPFGHALDSYVGYVNKYESTPNPDKVYSRLYVERYLSTTLKNIRFDPGELIRIMDPKDRAYLTGFDALIGDLVDSSMDMDRMDYLIRDAHMTGLNMGFTNAEALIQCVRPVRIGNQYSLAYDESGLEYMSHLLYAREAMYISCYEHPRKRAAERLFEKMVREVSHDDPQMIDDLYLMTDEELLCAVRLAGLNSQLAHNLLSELMANADYVLVHDFPANSPNISEEARVWLRGAAKGKGKTSYIDRPAEWEDAIARRSVGAERSFQIQVIVAPPVAYDPKFNAATILFHKDGAYQTDEFFNMAPAAKGVLSAMNPARARIKVMCPSAFSETQRQMVQEAAIEELGY